MGVLHITESELARDLSQVLAKVEGGTEVIVERDHRPVAILRPPDSRGRLLSESIALAEARGTTATPDPGFMTDVDAGIEERSKPWRPPAWE